MGYSFPHIKQNDSKDCGPTCLKIIAKYHGKNISSTLLRELSETTRDGSNLKFIGLASEKLGYRSLSVKISLNELNGAPLPCILHWNKNHFVVLYKISKGKYYVSDPGSGIDTFSEKEFLVHWIGDNVTRETKDGVCMLLERTGKFDANDMVIEKDSSGWSYLTPYLKQNSKLIKQLLIGLIGASLIQLAFPFLTQNLVDIGIKNQDLDFVYLILAAQIFLFLGRTVLEVIRGWLLLNVSTRLNISLVSDFIIKLMKLPIAYYDIKQTGDIIKRVYDHKRIELLLKNSSLNALFSSVTLVVFGIVLAIYNQTIFLIFSGGTIIYFAYLLLFLRQRRHLDNAKFKEESSEYSKLTEMIGGMQDIKLHNAETIKRWGWEFIQARIFNLNMKSLTLTQYQLVGSNFINELKNILITVLAAKLVINGEITLGMMLAISFIVGQLNAPISQMIEFILNFQDAKISMSRISEIHRLQDEDDINKVRLNEIPDNSDLDIYNVSFRYLGVDRSTIDHLSFVIPSGKVTALVGESGSGKTTLMKLLLQFYSPSTGAIKIGNTNLEVISQPHWRSKCGIVMQEGFLFNDTIAGNIALGDDEFDKERLNYSVHVANIKEFIEALPLSYNTKIGSEGLGISTGQKQRILIARAVYKNPDFLFLDEATSALDAKNEQIILKNLEQFYHGKTVFIIAHRLSTVQNADQIIVLEDGRNKEQGTHNELILKKGKYFNLIKNQLALGS